MSKIDKFASVGDYQVSSLLASSHFCELYEAQPEQTQNTLSVILAHWPKLEISGTEEADTFQQKVRQGSIRSGAQVIPILDAGFDKGHPYIVTPYSLDMLDTWRKQVSFIDHALLEAQRLHPDDARALIDALLATFMSEATEAESAAPASPVEQDYLAPTFYDQAASASTASDLPYAAGSTPSGDGPQPRNKRKVKWYQIVLLVLLLALLIWGGSAIYAIIPASLATVTITPMKQQLTQNYSFGVVAGKPAAFEIQGRQISVTSQRISKTVTATGKGHHNATQARGTVVLTQIHLFNPHNPGYLVTTTIPYADGVRITTEKEFPLSEGGTLKIPAHVEQAGSIGNLPADDIDGPTDLISAITKVQDGTAYASNPAPFTGGTDARDFAFVQQSDLDHVTKPFISQVTSATQERVMKQIRAGEHLAKDVQCKPAISSDHRVKDEASDVTIQVSLTCQALVYSEQTVYNAATSAYQHDGVAKFGAGYSIVGAMVMGTITAVNTIANSAPQLSLNVAAIWSFQYTDARKQDIGHLIAGKSQDAVRLLLHARKDIQDVAISTSGVPGSALPSSLTNITIVVKKVTGLRASAV